MGLVEPRSLAHAVASVCRRGGEADRALRRRISGVHEADRTPAAAPRASARSRASGRRSATGPSGEGVGGVLGARAWVLYVGLTFGGRILLQLRSTASTGFQGSAAGPVPSGGWPACCSSSPWGWVSSRRSSIWPARSSHSSGPGASSASCCFPPVAGDARRAGGDGNVMARGRRPVGGDAARDPRTVRFVRIPIFPHGPGFSQARPARTNAVAVARSWLWSSPSSCRCGLSKSHTSSGPTARTTRVTPRTCAGSCRGWVACSLRERIAVRVPGGGPAGPPPNHACAINWGRGADGSHERAISGTGMLGCLRGLAAGRAGASGHVFTWGMTALGAALVFGTKNVPRKLLGRDAGVRRRRDDRGQLLVAPGAGDRALGRRVACPSGCRRSSGSSPVASSCGCWTGCSRTCTPG